jgi:hypothetical protein
MAELDDRGRDAADGLLAKVTAVARAEAARAVAEKLNNVVEGGRLNWDMLTQWGHRLLDNGTLVPIRPNLDLVGFTVTDVPAGDLTRVTGGGGNLRHCSALLSNDASLPVAHNTVVLVPLDLDEYDPDDWHSTTTTTHKITVLEEGDYVIFARFTWENDDATGNVGTRTFTINGTGPGGFYGASRVDPASSTVSHLHQELTHAEHLVAGTSCWMEVLQNSGGTLQAALASNRRENPRLTVVRLDAGAGSGTGGDWVEVASHTVPTGGGESSIDFASLPQTYRALVAVGDNVQYETFSATTGHPTCFLMNGWNGNDYLERVHRFGDSGGSIHDVVTPTSANAGTVGYAPGGAGDDPVGSFVCWFPGYASTTKYKTYHGHAEYGFGTTRLGFNTGGFIRLGSAAHINVDQLTFYAGYSAGGAATDLFAPGTRITIYGVR